MNTVIHRAGDRGRGDYGWLTTRYSFSFADWYNPARTGFGKLLVINDDRISADNGFGMHQHRDMEIITIVTSGTLTHKDSMGNVGTVVAGEVQVMSAGTGVAHSEYNASTMDSLELFQIWILPKELGIAPRYGQTQISDANEQGLTQLVGPLDTTLGLGINQDAYISKVTLDADKKLSYAMHQEGNGAYVFVVSGSIEIAGESLFARDAIGITDTSAVEISVEESAEFLIIEVPI
ncbi:MAG: pirin family protein [Parcubacteria group bacterium]|nr:pirin family protein [Parcubacteria group bacterium]